MPCRPSLPGGSPTPSPSSSTRTRSHRGHWRRDTRSPSAGEDCPLDPVRGGPRILVLPDTDHGPAAFTQDVVDFGVPFRIPLQLLTPEFRVGARQCPVLGAAMPEATVD